MPKVSVIIPAYNRSMYIAEAIDSIVQQTYSDWELIVVDDFSTDNTESIINDFISKYGGNKIRYFKNECKKGVSGARNTGIKHAKGVYVAFLDSDDLWDKDHLRTKVETLGSDPNIDALLSDSHFFGAVEDGYMVMPNNYELFHDNYWEKYDSGLSIAKKSIIPFILKSGFIFRIPSLIIRKILLSKTGTFNENMIYYEDLEFIFRCFCEGRVGYINKKLCYIRRHSYNTSNVYDESVRVEADILFARTKFNYAMKFDPDIANTVLRIVLRDACTYRATLWFKDGNLAEAKKCILEAIRIKCSMKALTRLCGIFAANILPKNITNMLIHHLNG